MSKTVMANTSNMPTGISTDYSPIYTRLNESSNGSIGNVSVNLDTRGRGYPPYPPFQSPPLQLSDMITLPIYGLIFILAVTGNLLVIITLIQNKRMRTVTNVFLLNLSVSDLLLAVLCMPFTIIPIMLKNFIFGEFICVSIRYLQGVAVSVSCFTLVAISMERYFAICRPLHSRQWQTLKHSYKTIGVCWVAAFILNIPTAVFTKFIPLPMGNNMCREIWEEKRTLHLGYTFTLDAVLLILPVAIMALSYGRISYTLWSGMRLNKQEMKEQNGQDQMYRSDDNSSSKDLIGRIFSAREVNGIGSSRKASTKLRFNTLGIRQSNSEKSRASKKRVIKMLFAIVLEFFICWTPLFVVQSWITIDYEHATQHISPLIHTTLFVLSYVSSCCNPITYCFINKNFRNGFKAVFCCCKSRTGIRGRNEMPSYFQYSTARSNCTSTSAYDKVNCRDESGGL